MFTDGENVLISVRDNGPGIPDDELDSIFEPFHRSRSARDQHGSGLGLAICKRIVESHGGKIWADNAAGGGAVIRISLGIRGGDEHQRATGGI